MSTNASCCKQTIGSCDITTLAPPGLSRHLWSGHGRKCLDLANQLSSSAEKKPAPYIDLPACKRNLDANPRYFWFILTHIHLIPARTAQGGGGSFKYRKPAGEVGCCHAWVAEQIHWWIERWLERRPFELSIYLPVWLTDSLTNYLTNYLTS